jgi:hypothetical protein
VVISETKIIILLLLQRFILNSFYTLYDFDIWKIMSFCCLLRNRKNLTLKMLQTKSSPSPSVRSNTILLSNCRIEFDRVLRWNLTKLKLADHSCCRRCCCRCCCCCCCWCDFLKFKSKITFWFVLLQNKVWNEIIS